jgi:superfamily II DNA/RNA helicase
MRASLTRWIGDADALWHLERFSVGSAALDLRHIRDRAGDYYISLVGELFDQMRTDATDAEWARLGNAFYQFASDDHPAFSAIGVSKTEAALFSAAAFYCGGYPASAYLVVSAQPAGRHESETYRACFDLMGHRTAMTSELCTTLLRALRRGEMDAIRRAKEDSILASARALPIGPEEWIPARLLEKLLARFAATNIRAVLPEGPEAFWTPLVNSLIDRTPSVWEFFPSQIQAIHQRLLQSDDTFSLQMPTGAGKTALSETLLYWHATRNPDAVAVLLVPYRSLASELRATLVRRLIDIGISARCAYGGTVPSGDEVGDLATARILVATPESLSGVLSADPAFFRRISLVICDEGHLLDGGERGVGLELLLARMRAREGGAPRLVFVSAIVPNIEEINSWLGGNADSIVRSDYRPAIAEFAVLRRSLNGSGTVALEMHPHEPPPVRFEISPFLSRANFQFVNPGTGRLNTYGFTSVKTQAIAAARKSLAMGTTAVFAANKRGNQGAVGLAEELLNQLSQALSLPEPTASADLQKLQPPAQYLEMEYGADWIGTRTLLAGTVLHHGDIPQETREVLENLLRSRYVRLAICTSTLAEGVNLPIRTLVLYSVQRRAKGGRSQDLLARDIKNLVGRAGRAGATMKGLVICANAAQWEAVERVARQAPTERVNGALRALMGRLQQALRLQNLTLSNDLLERTPRLYTLVDGIDATLIDLAAEEVGEEELVQLAIRLADQTFASSQATLDSSKKLLQDVFALRARRVAAIRAAGRLGWIRETGARARMLDSVERDLLPMRANWDDVIDPLDRSLVTLLLNWAWTQRDLTTAVRDAYRLEDSDDIDTVRPGFFELVSSWLSGDTFVQMARRTNLPMDDLLGVHTQAVAFNLQTLIEQAVALLTRVLESQGLAMADAVAAFPEHLRFGVPTPIARVLSAHGVRHRRAAVELGRSLVGTVLSQDPGLLFSAARQLVENNRPEWDQRLGSLMVENTLRDLSSSGAVSE